MVSIPGPGLPGRLGRKTKPRPGKEKRAEWQIETLYAPGVEEHRVYGRAFFSKYTGRCSICGEEYQSGDRVHYVEGQGGRVAHEGCEAGDEMSALVEEDAAGLSPKQVAEVRSRLCTVHFTELPKSGICGEC